MLNKICNHFSTLPPTSSELLLPANEQQQQQQPPTVSSSSSNKDSIRQLRQRLNLLFKFMLSLFEFLNCTDELIISKDQQQSREQPFVPNHMSGLLGFDLRPTREALKHNLVQYLASPLYIRLNNNTYNNNNTNSTTSGVPQIENYLLLLNELPYESRKMVLVHSLTHLRQFVRKYASFAPKILEFVDSSQLIYLLKHADIESTPKSELLNLCSDIFATSSSSPSSTLNSSQVDYILVLLRFIEANITLEETDNTSTGMLRFVATALGRLHPSSSPTSTEALVNRLTTMLFKTDRRSSLAELNCLELDIMHNTSSNSMPSDRVKDPASSMSSRHASVSSFDRSLLLPRLCRLIEFLSKLFEPKSATNALKFELVWRVLCADEHRVLKLVLNFLTADFNTEEAMANSIGADAEPLNELRQAAYLLFNGMFKFTSRFMMIRIFYIDNVFFLIHMA